MPRWYKYFASISLILGAVWSFAGSFPMTTVQNPFTKTRDYVLDGAAVFSAISAKSGTFPNLSSYARLNEPANFRGITVPDWSSIVVGGGGGYLGTTISNAGIDAGFFYGTKFGLDENNFIYGSDLANVAGHIFNLGNPHLTTAEQVFSNHTGVRYPVFNADNSYSWRRPLESVITSGLSYHDFLVYNSTAGAWVNKPASAIPEIVTSTKFTNISTQTRDHIQSVVPFGGHPAAGSNRQVQYNNLGTPAGAAMLSYTSGYTKIGNGNYISEQSGALTFTNKTTATLKTALTLDAYGRISSNAKFTTSASLIDGRGYQLSHTASSGSSSINSYPRAMFAQLATFTNFTAGGATTTVPTDVVGLQGQTNISHRAPYTIGLFGRTVLAAGASVYHKALGLRGAVQATTTVTTDEAIGVESSLQLANTSNMTATRFIYFNASEDVFGTGASTFTEYYGIKLPSLTRGTSINYSLYAPSGTLYNGGKVVIGATPPDGKLTVKGDGTTTGLNITVKDSADSTKITVLDSGLTKFSNGGGFPYGQMYSNTATTITVSSSGVWYEVDTGATDFTAGRIKNVTHTDHYLTAPTAGDYQINAAASFGTSAAGDEIALSVMVNGTASATCHGHATVVTATTTVPSSCVTILTLAANDQVSLAVQNHSAARNITLSHSQLSILHVGAP